jgi:ABC-type branched-subunit amino acid transport system ATPase component
MQRSHSESTTAAPNENLKLQAVDATAASLSGGAMRSVDFTAAAEDNFSLLAVDATAASLSGGEMQSVIQTDAPKYRRSGRANSVPKYGGITGMSEFV